VSAKVVLVKSVFKKRLRSDSEEQEFYDNFHERKYSSKKVKD